MEEDGLSGWMRRRGVIECRAKGAAGRLVLEQKLGRGWQVVSIFDTSYSLLLRVSHSLIHVVLANPVSSMVVPGDDGWYT